MKQVNRYQVECETCNIVVSSANGGDETLKGARSTARSHLEHRHFKKDMMHIYHTTENKHDKMRKVEVVWY